MSDRKYRQRGYQDDPRDREPRPTREPQKREVGPRGSRATEPRTINMPGFREVVRCARCGNELTVATVWSLEGQCSRCGADLHSCAQCVSFDTSAPFECARPIPVRISPKDTRNTCDQFEPRTTVERETKSTPPAGARKAFDDLFK